MASPLPHVLPFETDAQLGTFDALKSTMARIVQMTCPILYQWRSAASHGLMFMTFQTVKVQVETLKPIIQAINLGNRPDEALLQALPIVLTQGRVEDFQATRLREFKGDKSDQEQIDAVRKECDKDPHHRTFCALFLMAPQDSAEDVVSFIYFYLENKGVSTARTPIDLSTAVANKLVERLAAQQCNLCAKPSTSLCSACHAIYYCTRECQKTDWAVHKPFCEKYRLLKKASDRAPADGSK